MVGTEEVRDADKRCGGAAATGGWQSGGSAGWSRPEAHRDTRGFPGPAAALTSATGAVPGRCGRRNNGQLLSRGSTGLAKRKWPAFSEYCKFLCRRRRGLPDRLWAGVHLQAEYNHQPEGDSYAPPARGGRGRHGFPGRAPWGLHHVQPFPALQKEPNLYLHRLHHRVSEPLPAHRWPVRARHHGGVQQVPPGRASTAHLRHCQRMLSLLVEAP